ncbi:MAG: GGDEF domain-containing phosphodiesterase [Enterocloster sp.]|nr:GGDEF domain-containing phosphodiesterase [Enterocloster sp.]
MMMYNADFLIAAVVILLLVLRNFLDQKRAEDLNSRIFLFFAVIGILDVIAELVSNYYITSGDGDFGLAAVVTTTIFYLFQALLPYALLCYIMTLHDNKLISVKKMLLAGLATILLASIVLTNPFTEKLFYFDVSAGYVEGPWYRLIYYSALFHLAVILILVISWRKEFGPQKTKVILDILILCGCGVVIQLLHYSLLMTGFGMSLGILALFLTINNPNANRDSLTGVYNHLYLTRRSDELIAAGKSFHIITIYLYQLKHINKVSGVEGGDYILQLTAKKLEELCGSRVFRITGKRFLVLTISLQEYEYYITQIKKMFETDMQLDADSSKPATPVILSGIVHGQKLGTSGLMLEYAEYLESLSMQNGMIEVIQDDQQTMDGFLYNKKVEQYLHTAIAQDLFEVYYQPVYSTEKNDFVTLEALSRLHHPELGWIAPDVFIQIAEKNHMIEQITDLQFKRVCMFINEHRDLMKKLFNIKVNLSSMDLMRSDCSSHFIRMMDDMDIHHDWIQFEITETVATEYNAGLGMVIDGFMAAGVRLCLDDFGSGYANLNTVMRLPFSAIKIDRTLLFDICNDKKRAMFYQSIVETFHRMGYSIVSEGVETEEEMSLLSSWGVDMIQGYYFSRPLPVDELLKLLNM